MKYLTAPLILSFVVALAFSPLCIQAEEPKAADSDLYSDVNAGFSMKIPAGFTRLNDEENREAFNRLSEHLGKEAGERALRQPPLRYKGAVNPKNPNLRPPAMTVTVSGLQWVIESSKLDSYKELIENDYKKVGLKHGEMRLSVVNISGINSLRAEHDIYSPVDNTPERIVMLIVPSNGRSYDIVFNYVAEQAPEVNAALETVMKSFKVFAPPSMSDESISKWTRIFIWTVGCFAAGLFVSFILRKLAGVNTSEPTE